MFTLPLTATKQNQALRCSYTRLLCCDGKPSLVSCLDRRFPLMADVLNWTFSSLARRASLHPDSAVIFPVVEQSLRNSTV